jgi:hypothetical protein
LAQGLETKFALAKPPRIPPVDPAVEQPWGSERYSHIVGNNNNKFAGACASGYEPQFTELGMIKKTWYIELGAEGNPFRKEQVWNGTEDAIVSPVKWSWIQIKGLSRGPDW